MNNLAILQSLVFEPGKAFAELDLRPRYWWPLLVLVISNTALTLMYTSVVDLAWVADQALRQSPAAASLTEEEIGRLVSTANSQREMRAAIGAAATAIALMLGMLVAAAYYLLATWITGVQRSFRHWFSLCSWCSIPSAVAVIPAAILLLTANSNQISQSSIQPMSINELFVHREPQDPGYSLFATMNLFQLASLYLSAMGLRCWSGRTWTYSLILAGLPYLLVYGVWGILAW
jgi:hypothetical protein